MSAVDISQGEGNVVQEYEVFKNKRDALAFFFFHQPVLDKNPLIGPFWFSLKKDSIVAGTEIHSVVFKDFIATVREEGFDPKVRQHVRDFNLKHPDSFQTLTAKENKANV